MTFNFGLRQHFRLMPHFILIVTSSISRYFGVFAGIVPSENLADLIYHTYQILSFFTSLILHRLTFSTVGVLLLKWEIIDVLPALWFMNPITCCFGLPHRFHSCLSYWYHTVLNVIDGVFGFQTLICDVNSLTSDGNKWTPEDRMMLESNLLLATQEPLCLEPSITVALVANYLHHSKHKFGIYPIKK